MANEPEDTNACAEPPYEFEELCPACGGNKITTRLASSYICLDAVCSHCEECEYNWDWR